MREAVTFVKSSLIGCGLDQPYITFMVIDLNNFDLAFQYFSLVCMEGSESQISTK